MPSPTIARPDVLDDTGIGTTGEYGVIVFNNDQNTFEQVIDILMRATGCPHSEAEMEAWEVHNQGRSLVHYGDRPECERAAGIISSIGIKVSVDRL